MDSVLLWSCRPFLDEVIPESGDHCGAALGRDVWPTIPLDGRNGEITRGLLRWTHRRILDPLDFSSHEDTPHLYQKQAVDYGGDSALGIRCSGCYLLAVMKRYIRYKAGPHVFPILKDEGLDRRRIAVFAGPAGGPKWFVSVGFDKAILRTRFLEHGAGRVLLVGSSAGGWRCLAMSCRDPLSAYEKLRLGYSRNVFTAEDTARSVSAAFRKNMEEFIADEDLPYIVDHPVFDVAVHTVRSKGPCASSNRRIEGAGIVVAALLNAFSPAAMAPFYERIVFFAAKSEPRFLQDNLFRGRGVRLSVDNVRHAALATGSLPYIMAGVDGIPHAPTGVYRDGGLCDYQLNQDYAPGNGKITLFFHYQERIVPGWLDKKLAWRRPDRSALANLLQVFPGEDFVKMLPDKRIPDRNDFIEFVDDPAERIRRWDEASDKSDVVAEQFMEDVESGAIRRLVEPI